MTRGTEAPRAPHGLRRRDLLVALAAAGLANGLGYQSSAMQSAPGVLIENVSRLYPVQVAKVVVPSSVQEVVQVMRGWPGTVAVGGARYSMGGQTGAPGGLHIDMRAMNALVWLNAARHTVRVQAGMRWRDLQDPGPAHTIFASANAAPATPI
ncbi:FAD-dependent oxidoreductase [Acidovorax sp. LjRoot129]|uniref:FAD-binding protein n=1 Tax=Acidovorax sp. LjRoot129 TaxID=3342260 RepID=UPI003ECC7AF2